MRAMLQPLPSLQKTQFLGSPPCFSTSQLDPQESETSEQSARGLLGSRETLLLGEGITSDNMESQHVVQG